MAAVVIVGVQPAEKLSAAFGVAGVEPRVGPFVDQGSMESLHLAVGLRPIRAGSAVLGVAEGVAECV